ncbi:MAG: hypothetical protein ACE5GW_02515 [Planctomycetota bacterium]
MFLGVSSMRGLLYRPDRCAARLLGVAAMGPAVRGRSALILMAALVIGIVVVSPSGALHGQCALAQLAASGGGAGDRLGHAVSISGDVAVAGSPFHEEFFLNLNAGAASVYRWTGGGWVEETLLIAGDGGVGEEFGFSVAALGDLVMVGARYAQGALAPHAGAAYLYHWDGSSWTQEWKLTASDGLTGEEFGFSIDLTADLAIVGAPHSSNPTGVDTGCAYIYRKVGGVWLEEARMAADDGVSGDRFGASVAIDGDVAVVGAPLSSDIGTGSGAAYVYRHVAGAWTQELKLIAADASAFAQLGTSVSASGGAILAGAIRAQDGSGDTTGAGYVFRDAAGTWLEEAKLLPSSGGTGDLYGASVDLEGDRALLGSELGEGAALFERSAGVWAEGATILIIPPILEEHFGASVSLSGDRAMIGAPFRDGTAVDSGGVELFFVGVGTDCNFNGILDECDIASGSATDCNGNGLPDTCDLLAGTSSDCNGNSALDECEIALGLANDCNGNGLLDICEITAGTAVDCDGNGVLDECEIAGGAADCDGNGVVDACEIAAGTATDCDGNGVIDECEIAAGTADCNGNGLVDACEIAGGTATDCDGNGVIDSCELAAGTAADCDGNGLIDPCEIAAGTAADCDANGLIDGCEIAAGTAADCDGSGVIDSCEIAGGVAADCDGNGVIDGCDIATGTAGDCNGNAIPDSCDILAGTSTDANGDGIPDECPAPLFLRGDISQDGNLNMLDVVEIVAVLFDAGAPGPCNDVLDVNDDGGLDVADVIYLLQYLFNQGPAIPPPFEGCGIDPTGDGLICTESQVSCP